MLLHEIECTATFTKKTCVLRDVYFKMSNTQCAALPIFPKCIPAFCRRVLHGFDNRVSPHIFFSGRKLKKNTCFYLSCFSSPSSLNRAIITAFSPPPPPMGGATFFYHNMHIQKDFLYRTLQERISLIVSVVQDFCLVMFTAVYQAAVSKRPL